jgi:hypothetical protein
MKAGTAHKVVLDSTTAVMTHGARLRLSCCRLSPKSLPQPERLLARITDRIRRAAAVAAPSVSVYLRIPMTFSRVRIRGS